MISLELTSLDLRLRVHDNTRQVFDPVRRRWVSLTPEEHVRQVLLHNLIHIHHYPAALIAVERAINVAGMLRRYDIAVFDRNHQPWLLAECKRPDVPVTEEVLHQLLAYHSTIPCRYWLLTNGPHTYCADAGDINNISWLDALPAYTM